MTLGRLYAATQWHGRLAHALAALAARSVAQGKGAYVMGIAAAMNFCGSTVLAAPTNEEFFQSVRENMDKPVDPSKFIAVLLAAVGVILLVMLFNRKRERQIRPKVLNHPGKLIKEIAAAVHLKPSEMKQLKLLADGQGVSGPITLLLCPSVLARAVREKSSKIDKKIVAQIARKLMHSDIPGEGRP